MSVTHNRLAKAMVAFAAVAAASPGVAQESSQLRLEEQMSAPRAAAVYACSVRSDKYTQRIWGVWQIQIYRACMAEHSQIE